MNWSEFFRPTPAKLVSAILLIFFGFIISFLFYNLSSGMGYCNYDCGATYGIPLPVYHRSGYSGMTKDIFVWEDVPGRDNDKLIDFLYNEYLYRDFIIAFTKDQGNIQRIEKVDANNISIFYKDLSISLRINGYGYIDRHNYTYAYGVSLILHNVRDSVIDNNEMIYNRDSHKVIARGALSKPEIFYNMIILQIIFWYVVSCILIRKNFSVKRIIFKMLLYLLIILGLFGWLSISTSGIDLLLIIISSIIFTNLSLLYKTDYTDIQNNLRFSTHITLITCVWSLMLIGSIRFIWIPKSFFLLFFYICIIIGTFAGMRIKNKVHVGLIIFSIPYVIILILGVFYLLIPNMIQLLSQEIQIYNDEFTEVFFSAIKAEKLIMFFLILVFDLLGSYLNSALLKPDNP